MSFTIRCDKCQSEDVIISVNPGEYEDEVYIKCEACKNEIVMYC